MKTRIRLIVPLASLLLLQSCNFGKDEREEPPSARRGSATKVEPGFNLLSPEQDVEIGRTSAVQVKRQLPILDDPQTVRYVRSLGERLAAHAPGEKFPYEFNVVNASDLNAFALPGGFIFLNRGVLESAKSEGEVAGVLAHEIAHVALRHGTHNVSKAYLTQAGVGLLGGLLGSQVGESAASIINMVGGAGLNALFLKYSRTAETQADIAGVQMLAKAGYDPDDMVSFFETLRKADQRRTVNWLSDHPAPERRIETIRAEAARLERGTSPARDSGTLRQVQAVLGGRAPAGTLGELATKGPPADSQQRTGRVNIPKVGQPSSETRAFRSGAGIFEIAYPSNWQVHDDNRGGATIAPTGGTVDIGGATEIVYGAIVSHYEPIGDSATAKEMGRGSLTIEEATADLIGTIQQTSPHLQLARGSERRLTLRDGPALGVTLVGKSPNTGISERVSVVTSRLEDGHLVFVLFVNPESEATRYAPVFDSMLRSLRVMASHRH